jgi:NADH-quinone oxidoreductase subunit J
MGAYTLVAAISSHPTIPDIITFVIAALAALVGAMGVVFTRNPVHSALMLVATLFSVAVLFVEQNAQFLAAVQVIVYTGAIVVLILFVIMLLGVDRREVGIIDAFRGQQYYAVLLGLLILLEVLLLSKSNSWITGAHSTTKAISSSSSNVSQLGQTLFTTYLIPFEATSALLVVAVIGAVVLARRPRQKDGQSLGGQSELQGDSPEGSHDEEDTSVLVSGGEENLTSAEMAVTGAGSESEVKE